MTAILHGMVEVAIDAVSAFEQAAEDLATGLEPYGLVFEPFAGGRILARGAEIGRVARWQPGEGFTLVWAGVEGAGVEPAIVFAFRSVPPGTEVGFEVRNWTAPLGPFADALGWLATQVAAPLLHALGPSAAGDWITDRVARRPSGRWARDTYRDPLFHYPNFRVILEELALAPDDVLLDVGCGGGVLLREGLKSGCRAAGVDHSAEMVRVAREANAAAVAARRLHVVRASAERLPFAAGTFTCAAMTGVLGFLPDPVIAFAEIRSVLRPRGRVVALGSDPRLRGTPAAPEPIASRLRFYEDEDLVRIARAAGFDEAGVIRRDLEPHARAAGVPEEHVPLFAGLTSFLVAKRA
jgi:SAM-dependent methyltransferase